eukprot:3171217-Karenia_brevis.AAC.1
MPCATPTVAMSKHVSCTCGKPLAPDVAAAATAVIQTLAGQATCLHVPLRCQDKACRRRYYYNYAVHDSTHTVDLPDSMQQLFFISAVQAFQATFTGEADVQGCSRKLLSRAYTLWQLSNALQEMKDAG